MAYCNKDWRCAISRTAYTLVSDSFWPQAIDTIDAYMAHVIRETLAGVGDFGIQSQLTVCSHARKQRVYR